MIIISGRQSDCLILTSSSAEWDRSQKCRVASSGSFFPKAQFCLGLRNSLCLHFLKMAGSILSARENISNFVLFFIFFLRVNLNLDQLFLRERFSMLRNTKKKRNLVFNLPMKFWGLINNKKILLGYLWSIITNQTSPCASSWKITKTDLPEEYFVGWGMQAASSWHLLPEKFFFFSSL